MAATFDAVLRIAAKTTGDGDIRRLQGSMESLRRAGDGVRSALGAIAATVGVVGFAALGQSIARTGIESQQATIRIKALAGSYGEIEAVTDVAARAAQQFALSNVEARNAVTDLYGRLRPMGVSLKDVETVFFGVNKAARQMGLGTEDVNGVMLQLSQALGSGRLQGDELRSIMERMPAVGQAVAKVMGVTAGDIKKLGSEGKITTEVMIQAARELNKIQPPPPTPFQQFSAAQQNLQETLGNILLPTLTKVAIAATSYAKRVQSFVDRNREAFTTFAKAIVETTGALAPILGRVAAIVIAYKTLQGVIAAATLATKAFALVTALTPQGLAMLAVSAGVGLIAFQKLKAAMDSATEGVKGMASETDTTSSIAQRLQEAWNSVSANVDNASQKTETAKKKAENYEKIIAAAVQQTNSQYDLSIKQINLRTAAAQRSSAIAVEQNNLQVAFNSLGQAVLQNKLAMAQSDDERLRITKEIADLESQAARLQYQATMQQIAAEEQLLKLKEDAAHAEWEKANAAYQTAVNLANQGRISRESLQGLRAAAVQASAAASAASRELQQAYDRGQIQRQIAGVNQQIANTRIQGQIQQAQTGTQAGTAPMGQPRYFIETPGGRIPQFATGGFVNRRTLAEIGEAGPEYVVPQSKALGFANNIVAGRTGARAIPSWTDQMRVGHLAPSGGFTSNQQVLAALRRQGIEATITPWSGIVVNRRAPLAGPSGRGSFAGFRPPAGQMNTNPVQSLGPVQVQQNLRIDRVERRNDGDYVTLSAAEKLAADASTNAVNQMVRLIQQPTFRREVGIA